MDIDLPKGDELHKPGDILGTNSPVQLDPRVLSSFEKSAARFKQQSDEPIDIYENTYIDPENETEGAYDLVSETPLETEEDEDPYAFETGTESPDTEDSDPYALEDPESIPDPELEELQNATDAEWKPKSLEQFMHEELNKSKEIQLDGMVENSFIRHAYEWIREVSDDDYVSELSIEGRLLAINDIDKQIEELGAVALTDFKNIRKAKELWNARHGLNMKNILDKQMLEAEMPSFSEMRESIVNDWEGFGKSILQEIINKPELIFVPQFAAVRGAAVALVAAKSLNTGVKTTKILKASGMAAGAYTGGVSLGTLDRMATQHTKTGDADLARAFEQSQVDGALGVVLVGGGKTLSKAVETINAKRLASLSPEMLEALESGTKTVDDVDLEATVRDPMTETYVDSGGNVYTLEVRETVDSKELVSHINTLKKDIEKFQEDPQALSALKAEIDSAKARLTQDNLDNAEVKQLEGRLDSLEQQKSGLKTREDLEELMTQGSKRSKDETRNFITVMDKDGNKEPLRRLTRDVLNEGLPLKVEALGDVHLDPRGPTVAMNKYQAGMADFFVSATSSIQRLRNVSPTAGKLLDLLDPRATNGVRAKTETIQESIRYKQGEWNVRSNDIAKTLSKIQQVQLALHMRKVEISEDPVVIAAAKGYRELLDEAREYAIAGGQKVDAADDYLPRYYNQAELKDPMAQALLMEAIAKTRNKDGSAKYDTLKVSKSVKKIARNIIEDSDEGVYIERGGAINPIGNRSWRDVPDKDLHEFLDPEFIGSIDRYLNNTAQRVEVDKVFGYGGSKVKTLINQVARETEASGNGRILLETEKESLMDLYDLMSGKYGSNGNRAYKPATDSLLAFQAITKLPLVTVTSLLEPTTMLFRLEEGGKFKALANTVTRKSLRKLWNDRPIEQIEREAREVGLIHDVAIKERLEAMVGEGLEGLPAKATNKAMKLFMLHQWTEHTRVVAYEAARSDIMKMAKGLALQPVGRKSATRRRRLENLGLDPKAVATWIAEGASIDAPGYKAIKKASARYANQLIVNPNKINKGKWMSNNSMAARITSQFKTFSSTFFNEGITPASREISQKWNEGNKIGAMRDAAYLVGTLGAMAYWGGYKNDLLYSMFSSEEIEHDPNDVVRKLVSGALSYAAPGGYIYGPALTDQTQFSSLAGPYVSDLEKVRQSIAKGDPSKLIGLIPLADKAIKKVNEPDKRARR